MASSSSLTLREVRREAPSPTLLSAADEAWLRMEAPNNPMVICAVMVTSRPLALAEVRQLVSARILTVARLRQPLSRHPDGVDRPIDLDQHVRASVLGPGDEEAALRARLGELMIQPLPRDRPLWELHLVERYRGGSALVWRIHHAVGDGTALLGVLLGAADGAPAGLGAPAPLHRRPGLRDALPALASLARLLFLPRDARTALKAPLAGARRVAWSREVPLEEVKAVGHRTGATVNDVLTCALAGALHRHLAARGGAPPSQVRAIVPFDLRAGETDPQLGNRFGLLFLPLAVGALGPVERLAATQRHTARLKNSPEAFVAFAILRLIGAVSVRLAALAIRLFARKVTLVLTNVAGPRAQLSFGGAPISELIFWVPQAERIGVGVSIFSYAGKVRIGVNSDAACLASPQALADAFVEELAALARQL